jgi:hypothetical protein
MLLQLTEVPPADSTFVCHIPRLLLAEHAHAGCIGRSALLNSYYIVTRNFTSRESVLEVIPTRLG